MGLDILGFSTEDELRIFVSFFLTNVCLPLGIADSEFMMTSPFYGT